MSSPLSNLKKGKKAPLINATRAAPFKPSNISEEELISQLNLEKERKHCLENEQKDKVTSNSSLLSSMMKRLSDVEKKLVEYERTSKEKDKQINILKNKCEIYQRAKGYGNDQIAELERKCQKLQNQVHSMENFLEDYGMIWVGNPNSSDDDNSDDEGDDFSESEESSVDQGGNLFSEDKLWNPGCSYNAQRTFMMNFDLVLKNIKELNMIAGEGEHYIKHTKDGARLQIKEPVPLILYANGIFMFHGPFRPYEDITTQRCMQDIMDGYFPSELQLLYPDGVPFKVDDKRDTAFKEKCLESLFPGQGQTLSPEKRKDVVSLDNSELQSQHKTETIDDLTYKESVEKFLSKLPHSVMKNGKIIDIREGLKETLMCDLSKNEVIVIETDAVKDIKARVNSGRKSRPSTASAVTTLRIKSESGDQTYMLKMKYSDTIQDVHKHLDEVRKVGFPYLLKTSFPNQTYSNLLKTLKEYGLIPNATLHIVKAANS